MKKQEEGRWWLVLRMSLTKIIISKQRFENGWGVSQADILEKRVPGKETASAKILRWECAAIV